VLLPPLARADVEVREWPARTHARTGRRDARQGGSVRRAAEMALVAKSVSQAVCAFLEEACTVAIR
jgi:hypothetical protein